jgi:hypothetical protein
MKNAIGDLLDQVNPLTNEGLVALGHLITEEKNIEDEMMQQRNTI